MGGVSVVGNLNYLCLTIVYICALIFLANILRFLTKEL